MPINQSFAWWCFGRFMPASELIAHARRIGYQAVEMVPEDLIPQVVDGGLKIATMGGHQSIESGLNRKENHDRIQKEIETNLAKAQGWGKPALICFSGSRQGLSDAAGIENTIIGFRRVAKAAEQAGVTLIMELLNSKVDHADYQCDHTDWGAAVIAGVDSPNVKLLYDIYHMQIMEGDIIRTIQANMHHIGHFHTAGNPGRHEIDETQELWYPPIMKAIAATNYTGYVGQEFGPIGDALAGMEHAYKLCDI